MTRPLSPDSTPTARPAHSRDSGAKPVAVATERALEDAPLVVVAEPHPASRLGIRLTLERAGFVVAAEAATGDGAAALAATFRPDLCLVDVDVPEGGIVTARAIITHAPGTVVLLLGTVVAEGDLVAAIVAGASGCVPKTIAPERLAVVVRAVLAGEVAIPRASCRRLVEEVRTHGNGATPPATRGRPTLTPREAQVAELMHGGMPTREIAARLGISEVTVRRHVSAALRKLQVPDRATAVRLFRRSRAANATRSLG